VTCTGSSRVSAHPDGSAIPNGIPSNHPWLCAAATMADRARLRPCACDAPARQAGGAHASWAGNSFSKGKAHEQQERSD
jgi:hypothetical protein